MDLWDQFKYRWDHIGYVAGLVEQWDSSGCASEKECEDSLYRFLHDRLPEIQIVGQYGRGRSHVDLMVDDEVMIELKYMLSSASEVQRLVGQLVDYGDWRKEFILVLIGETDPGIIKQLKKEIGRQFPHNTPFEELARIIQKNPQTP